MNEKLIDRLSRRGVLTITVEDGVFDVRLTVNRPPMKIERADLFERCRLGASSWHSEGRDLDELLAACDDATVPTKRDIDDLVAVIEFRRDTRVSGPPLPSYQTWRGWRPGHERWLRAFDHAHEYLGGYLRDQKIEREYQARWTRPEHEAMGA